MIGDERHTTSNCGVDDIGITNGSAGTGEVKGPGPWVGSESISNEIRDATINQQQYFS